METIMPVLCQCGCGLPTTLSTRNSTKEKIKKGEYRQFIRGHHNKVLKQGYKRGWMINRGYIFILKPDHPFNNKYNYVKRARLVMEAKLGRYLISGEQVHHINGVRDDDRIDNLLLTTLEEHNTIHNKAKIMIQKRRKFTTEQILQIRNQFKSGATLKDVANQFGISKPGMVAIRDYKVYKEVV